MMTLSSMRYSFINTKLSGRKSKFIDSNLFEKLRAADSYDSVLRLLNSTPYNQIATELIGNKPTGLIIDRYLSEHYLEEYRALSGNLPGKAKQFAEIYKKRFYFKGLKSVIYGVHAGLSYEDINEFLILPEKEKSELEERTRTASLTRIIEEIQDSRLAKVLFEANSHYKISRNPIFFDLAIDKYYYASLIRGANDLLSGLDKRVVLRYVGYVIDIINIITVLRGIRARIPEDQLDDYLIKHFYKLKHCWSDLVKAKSINAVMNVLEGSIYDSIAQEFQQRRKLSMSEVEIFLQELLLSESQKLWLIPFNIGIFFAYFERKKMEIQQLRSILLEKMNL
ncbi:MAG: V-type ATPase subunit [Candidatus Hodarchaeales archaeon]